MDSWRERTPRSLKATLMAHTTPRWKQVLPFFLLGLRSVIKEDTNATAAELMYGTTIRLRSQFFPRYLYEQCFLVCATTETNHA
ncbi:hypothetical protein TNCV_1947751 [Trichonephila clavipes]|nr:hypothetical protein TNCV_1947751 [Trichonephila clavipes]